MFLGVRVPLGCQRCSGGARIILFIDFGLHFGIFGEVLEAPWAHFEVIWCQIGSVGSRIGFFSDLGVEITSESLHVRNSGSHFPNIGGLHIRNSGSHFPNIGGREPMSPLHILWVLMTRSQLDVAGYAPAVAQGVWSRRCTILWESIGPPPGQISKN